MISDAFQTKKFQDLASVSKEQKLKLTGYVQDKYALQRVIVSSKKVLSEEHWKHNREFKIQQY